MDAQAWAVEPGRTVCCQLVPPWPLMGALQGAALLARPQSPPPEPLSCVLQRGDFYYLVAASLQVGVPVWGT